MYLGLGQDRAPIVLRRGMAGALQCHAPTERECVNECKLL